jgi:putative MATE family efflux protein
VGTALFIENHEEKGGGAMDRQGDLTQGSILGTLMRYAVPFIVSNVLQATYNITDMIIAGQFGGSSYAQSAIGNCTTVTALLTQIIIGLATGGSILIGQYFGARKERECRQSTVTLFTMSLLIGVVVSAALYLMADQIMVWMRAPALEQAQKYLRICALGMFFVTCYNGACAALRAVGNSKLPFFCVGVSVVVNIILDLVFMAGLHMGVAGAAWATVIAQVISAALAVCFVWRKEETFGLRFRALRMRGDQVRSILRMGIPCAIQMSVVSIAWIVVATLVNSYDVQVSAAYSVTGKISQFAQMFSAAMYSAVSGMVAQCAGAKDYERIRKAVYQAIAITLSVTLVLVLIVELSAPQLVAIFTPDDPVTQRYAAVNLRIDILGQLFFAVFMIYHGLAVGVGHTWFVFFSSFCNCILARLIFALTLNHLFGLMGLYWACMLAPFVSVPLGLWYERSNRWRRSLT